MKPLLHDFYWIFIVTEPLCEARNMSGSNEAADSSERTQHVDSPPTSPSIHVAVSSPVHDQLSSASGQKGAKSGDSSDLTEGLSDSSANQELASSPLKAASSPPSSPVRYGRKRPAYSTYKQNESDLVSARHASALQNANHELTHSPSVFSFHHSHLKCSNRPPLSRPIFTSTNVSLDTLSSLWVPRQTLLRWKKSRWESKSSDESESSDESKSSDKSKSSQARSDDGGGSDYLLVGEDFHGDGREGGDEQQPAEDKVLKAFDSVSETDSDSEVSNNSSNISGQNSSDDTTSNDGYLDSNNNDSGSEEASSDDGPEDPFSEHFLYSGSAKSTNEAILELLDIHVKNNLTKTALQDILKFYVSSLPPTHNMPPTVHHLFNYVKSLSIPLEEVQHFYCRPKMHIVDSRSKPCNVCSSTDIGVFYELPIETQIKFLFEHRGLSKLIDKYSEGRTFRDGNNICDIIDGSEYLRIWQGILSKYKLTLILNTDGVQPHVSSSAKFWPLMFTIMEVPPHLRPSFTIVWGIWFDKEFKPYMNTYLKPFVSSLIKIHAAGGISWKHSENGIEHTSPIKAPLFVADAPARAGVLHMQEHQARYACNTCEQKTNKLPAPPVVENQKRKKRKRRFLFKEEPVQLRTHERMVSQGRYAFQMGIEHKRGIKGNIVIKDIPQLDLSTCTLAEYMHSVLKGLVLQFFTLWFFVKGDWYVGDHLPEINFFLCNNIHPPDFVTRLPKSLAYLSYFKANELRSFLLYYVLIVVGPYMKDEYLQHWILFVEAIFLLLKDSISEDDLDAAEAMLRMFLRDIGKLYGDDQYTYNVHQMSHLVLYVKRWGSLSGTSAFNFEGFNGILSKMIHGSKNEGKELINELFLAQGVQMLKTIVYQDREIRVGNIEDVKVLGKSLSRKLTVAESQIMRNLNLTKAELYGRVSIRREIYSSKEYDKNMKRRNSYVEVGCNGNKVFGRIDVFCVSEDRVLCFISVHRVIHTKFFFHRGSMIRIKHIIPVEDTGEIIACSIHDLVQKLIQVGDYLCYRPNTIERNL